MGRKPSKTTVQERLGYDPSKDYPKIVTVRITFEEGDERDREAITDDLKAYLTRSNSRIHAKNVTVLNMNYLVDGKSVNATELESHR